MCPSVLLIDLAVVEQDDHRLSTSSYDSYRDSTDMMRLKTSAHLDRKLSSTARLPKRSTIVESPAGKVAHQTDVTAAKQQAQDRASGASVVTVRQPQQQLVQQPWSTASAMGSKHSIPSSDSTSTLNVQTGQQELRPAFARNNTRVVIMDDGPESPRPMEPGEGDPSLMGLGGIMNMGHHGRRASSILDEGLSLADIPQIIEVEQARVEQRSLPRQGTNPFLSDLSPLELQLVKHSALLTLYKSGLREQFDLEELLELIDVRRNNIWTKLFKGGQKPKKKGKSHQIYFGTAVLIWRQVYSVSHSNTLSNARASTRCLAHRDSHCKYRASSTMSSRQCGRWTCR